jgi:hypothetical protein
MMNVKGFGRNWYDPGMCLGGTEKKLKILSQDNTVPA